MKKRDFWKLLKTELSVFANELSVVFKPKAGQDQDWIDLS